MQMLLQEMREAIVEFGNKLLEEKLVHDQQGNISLYDREKGLMAITPSGIDYHVRKAEDICVMDLQGNILEGDKAPTSELALHNTLYRNRPDINAVIHTHPLHVCVFSVLNEPIPQVLAEATMGFSGSVPLAPYASPGTQKLADMALIAMEPDKKACVLANHGLLTAAADLKKALHISIAIEDAAYIVLMSRIAGGNINYL